jgi:Icc-related predicted phosphoesterase
VIRIAAVADIHFGADSAGRLRPQFENLPEHADVLLLGGDLTQSGAADEGAVMAKELQDLPVPVVAVLGNHDYHSDSQSTIRSMLEDANVTVLEGTNTTIEIDGARIGIAGTKGFGGGFAGACGTDFGEPEMKQFARHTITLADELEHALAALDDVDLRVALLHYGPIRGTLVGEKLEIYPFLGSYLLGEAVDRVGADLILHGHAHAGTEKGITPCGVAVRNVAQPVIKHAYNVYSFDPVRREVAEAARA